MIQITNLTKEFHGKTILKDVSVKIAKGDKIALLGQNGAGKSTFIKCLLGIETFEGEITSSAKIAYMEQEADLDSFNTYRDFQNNRKSIFQEKKLLVEKQLENPDIYEDQSKLDSILKELNTLNNDSFDFDETKSRNLLEKFHFSKDLLNQNLATLSGGEKTMLHLVDCLSSKADLYVLDEPTNHLDFKTINLLESYLGESSETFIIVTHDRYFMNRLATKIFDIENFSIVEYKSNYDEYLLNKKIRHEIMIKEHHSIEMKRTKLLESAKEKRIWAHKVGSKAFKIQADKLEWQANNLKIVYHPDTFKENYDIVFTEKQRFGEKVFFAKNISKSFEMNVFSNISFEILNNDRVALLGSNGSGKSTILKLLTQNEVLDSGTIEHGVNLEIGYFDQKSSNLPLNKTVKTYLEEVCPNFDIYKLKNLANKYGLSDDFSKKKINTLSGGEKGRIQLLVLSLNPTNVLILDEPTNHLDLGLRESLEDALNNYRGTIIFVSHDRYFLKKVAKKYFTISNGVIENDSIIF